MRPLTLRASAAVSVLSLLILGACSSSKSSDVSPDQACADLATNVCTKFQTCSPFLFQLAYADLATCTARQKLNCTPLFGASGTGLTGTNADACAQGFASSSCDDVLNGNSPAACSSIHGTLAAGTACGTDSQCSGDGSYCKLAAGTTCGVCSSMSAPGAACTTSKDCSGGLACANSLCVVRGAAGATCDATHPCNASLQCSKGTCATPLAGGATCDPTADACDHGTGLVCDGQDKVCKVVTLVPAGGQCGIVNGALVGCSGAGGSCQGATLSSPGTCQAPAADGAACDATNGPNCQAPATCVNGACALANPASCK